MNIFDNPTPPVPLENWFRDPHAPVQLRELLASPVFARAAAILLDAAHPTFGNSVGVAAQSDRLCWQAGYSDFVRDLLKLTKPPVSVPDAEPWGHLGAPAPADPHEDPTD